MSRRGALSVSSIPRARARHAARSPSALALPDGGTAELRGEALEIRDREGRLMVRYADGFAEISAPRGDLRLSAPEGRVVVQAGLDVAVEAGRDVAHRAGRRFEVSAAAKGDDPQLRIDHAGAEIKAERLEVSAASSRAVIGRVSLIAHAIATTADKVAVTAGDYEVMAERVVERARESLREIAGLAEERVGRVRALVQGVYSLSSRRTVLVSSDDTSIDGSRIQLG